jgi:hypothetical protein
MFAGVVEYIIMCCLAALFLISIYYNYKFGVTILKMQDSLESSLDILDKNYNTISEILEKPIFFDSVEVRQALNSISECRDSILYVANDLVGSVNETKEIDQE